MKDPETAEGPNQQVGESPFGEPDGAATASAGSAEGKPWNVFGLRNSEPPLEPRNIGQQLDMAAEWYEHLFTGFLKQSESGGTEAWMHYVVAAVLLADNELGILDESEREEVEDAADDWDHPEPEEREP